MRKARSIAAKSGLIGKEKLLKFELIAQAAKKFLDEENEADEYLGDIPDEFCDPLLATLIRDPVMLPTSGNIVDLATISRHLLSIAVDPFNRKLLTEKMKQKIEEFVSKRKAEARAKRTDAMEE